MNHFVEAESSTEYAATMPMSLEELEALAPKASTQTVLKLLVRGLLPAERSLIEGSVKLSRRRAVRLQLVDPLHSDDADVVLIDARDERAMAWAAGQTDLAAKPVIWLDAQSGPLGHLLARRPAPWSMLPSMLARAIDHHKAVRASEAGRAGQAADTHPAADSPVLIVETNAAARGELSLLFKSRGVDVVEAGDVAQALAILAKQPVAWVLAGMQIGASDSGDASYEACQQIKQSAPNLPLLMLGREGAATDRTRAKCVGAAALIMLPADVQHLYNVIDQSAASARALRTHAF